MRLRTLVTLPVLAALTLACGCEIGGGYDEGYTAYGAPGPVGYQYVYYDQGWYDGPYWYWYDNDRHLHHEWREAHEHRELFERRDFARDGRFAAHGPERFGHYGYGGYGGRAGEARPAAGRIEGRAVEHGGGRFGGEDGHR